MLKMEYTEIEVIRRDCCRTIYAGCAVHPNAMDEEWDKSVKEAKAKGHIIDRVKCGTGAFQFSECMCNKEIIDPDQLSLF